MTSSLVGSEMCIRDRAGTAPWCAAPGFVGAQTPTAGGVLLSGGNRLLAVSYTHLTLPTICSV
eukprot:11935327-Prorocentrum_lima.AAC.1